MCYALKLAMPNYVFINRGNHELRRMNEKYGFLDHVLDRVLPRSAPLCVCYHVDCSDGLWIAQVACGFLR